MEQITTNFVEIKKVTEKKSSQSPFIYERALLICLIKLLRELLHFQL